MMLEKLLVSFCSFGSNDTSGASSVNDGVSCRNACQKNLNILFQRSFMYHVRKLQHVLNHIHRFSQVDVFTFDFLLGIFHRLCWLPVKGFLFITWRLDCRWCCRRSCCRGSIRRWNCYHTHVWLARLSNLFHLLLGFLVGPEVLLEISLGLLLYGQNLSHIFFCSRTL